MELYPAGGPKWTYTCLHCLATILVLSPLESPLTLESLLESQFRSLA